MKKNLLIILAAGLLFFNTAFADADLSTDYQVYPAEPNAVSPSVFMYQAKPGQTIVDSLLLINLNKDSINKVEVYGVDATKTKEGNPAYLGKKSIQKGIGSWFKLTDKDISLKPDETRQMFFTITIPKDTPLGDYSGGIAAEKIFPNTDKTNSTSVNTALRLIKNIQIKVTDTPQVIPKQPPPKVYYLSWYFYASLIFFLAAVGYFLYSRHKNKTKHHAKKD